ncbi:response regulator transcription factor [Ectobacillus ponti]|uniref:Response regulator transcription factor n=1 Tax=Ectobacillus ponti TaxID=2961894 RepID=A0AA41X8B2_9BACI|nr:response regulator transcription factor [Ectobacillus ponti]MCP8967246.1 response regulator transcription factor [Ectobacillus ponti]
MDDFISGDVKQECMQFFEQNPFSLESAYSLQQKLGRKPEVLQAALHTLATEKRVKSFAGVHPLYRLQQEQASPVEPLQKSGEKREGHEGFSRSLHQLTKREKDIVKLLMQGKNNQEIGEALFISPNTVKNHITNIYAKLQVHDRYELISLVYKWQNSPCLF